MKENYFLLHKTVLKRQGVGKEGAAGAAEEVNLWKERKEEYKERRN